MRFLVRIHIPVQTGNAGLLDGTMMPQLKSYLDALKPEAVYFAIADGQRTVFLVVDIEGPEKLPAIIEPPWLDWEADVDLTMVMNAADFEKAQPAAERILKARK